MWKRNFARDNLEKTLSIVENIDGDLKVVLRALAYLDQSLDRIIYTLPMLIWNELCLKFCSELRDRLVTNLKLTGQGGYTNCVRLAVDKGVTLQRRNELEERRRTLEKAMRKLRQLERIDNDIDED